MALTLEGHTAAGKHELLRVLGGKSKVESLRKKEVFRQAWETGSQPCAQWAGAGPRWATPGRPAGLEADSLSRSKMTFRHCLAQSGGTDL